MTITIACAAGSGEGLLAWKPNFLAEINTIYTFNTIYYGNLCMCGKFQLDLMKFMNLFTRFYYQLKSSCFLFAHRFCSSIMILFIDRKKNVTNTTLYLHRERLTRTVLTQSVDWFLFGFLKFKGFKAQFIEFKLFTVPFPFPSESAFFASS